MRALILAALLLSGCATAPLKSPINIPVPVTAVVVRHCNRISGAFFTWPDGTLEPVGENDDMTPEKLYSLWNSALQHEVLVVPCKREVDLTQPSNNL